MLPPLALPLTRTRRLLREGDIVNVDVTVFLESYHGDTLRTFYVGPPSPSTRALVEANEEALREAIKVGCGCVVVVVCVLCVWGGGGTLS